LLVSHGADSMSGAGSRHSKPLPKSQKLQEGEKDCGAEGKSKAPSRVMRLSSGVDIVGFSAEETNIVARHGVSQATSGLEVIFS